MNRFECLSVALILVMIFSTSIFVVSASIREDKKTEALVSHFATNIVYANSTEGYPFGEVDVNLTRIPNQTISVDGVTDFYKVELVSNGKVIGSNIRGCSIGQGLLKEQMTSLSMSYGHVGFSIINNNQQIVKWDVWYEPSNPTLVEPLTIRLTKMGWVIVDGNEWLSKLDSNEVVQEVQLSKVENSYTYGTPISQVQPPSSPTPTVTSYLPPEDRNAPHLDPIYYLLPVSVFVVIVVILVLAFRRHRISIDS